MSDELRFSFLPASTFVRGRLTYVSADHALDFRQSIGVDDAPAWSVMVNDLHLEVSDSGAVLYVWGYCPLMTFLPTTLEPPSASPGVLRVDDAATIAPPGGASLRLTGPTDWPGYIDAAAGWLCIGEPMLAPTARAVQFADDCLAVGTHHVLTSLWLHPLNLPR